MDRWHNEPGEPFVEPDAEREAANHDRLKGEPVVLTRDERAIVEQTIGEVCRHRGWDLHAVHARTNHVHAVVRAGREPEFVMNSFKSWCTRRLVEAGMRDRGRRVWVRHGSTRYLWDRQSVLDCVEYTLNRQDDGGNTHAR